jgi:hypothetical protein|tara:strand:+ start:241 stop:567 length:327 start_codon:yes stop_codon:yes gene_type:complete
MAFVRKKVKTFKWPIKVEEPADGGVFETSTFDAVFKRLPKSEFQKFADKGDLDLLKSILIGWEGIEDEEGKPVPFSHVTMKEFSDDVYWTRGVLKAYTETFEGAKLGN